MILQLTWRNLWRNPRRTLITMGSVVFSVVLATLMQSMQTGTFDLLVRNVVRFHSGYAQVHAKGYWNEQVVENAFISNDSLIHSIQALPDVRGVVPRLECYALASVGERTRGCRLTGISPDDEDQMTGLASRLMKGQYLKEGDNAVLLAKGLAKKLGLDVGDTLVLLGQGYRGSIAAGKYPIIGIASFKAPQLDASMVYMNIKAAQGFLGAEENILTSLAIDLKDPGQLSNAIIKISPFIDDRYELMSWTAMMPDIDQHIRSDARGFYIWTGILYMIIAFGIFSTLLMMTAERKQEFGMLVAIGMKKQWLSLMLMMESLLISILGIIIGIALALPLVLYFQYQPIRFSGEGAKAFEQWGFEPILPTTLDSMIFLRQSLIVLTISIIIGIYPSWKSWKINPVKDMKR